MDACARDALTDNDRQQRYQLQFQLGASYYIDLQKKAKGLGIDVTQISTKFLYLQSRALIINQSICIQEVQFMYNKKAAFT